MSIATHIEDLDNELLIVASVYNQQHNLENAYEAYLNECELGGFTPSLTEEQFAFAWGGTDALVDMFTYLDHNTGKYSFDGNFINA